MAGACTHIIRTNCAHFTAKGNKLRIQNTRTLFQKKGIDNQMFQKTHVKILLMLSEYFSEQLKIHTKLTKITWNSGNTTEKLWKLSAENFWINSGRIL